jgi:hypothetical protein
MRVDLVDLMPGVRLGWDFGDYLLLHVRAEERSRRPKD